MNKGIKLFLIGLLIFIIIYFLIYLISPIMNINYDDANLINNYYLSSDNSVGLRFINNNKVEKYEYFETGSSKTVFDYEFNVGIVNINNSDFYLLNSDNSLWNINDHYYLYLREKKKKRYLMKISF